MGKRKMKVYVMDRSYEMLKEYDSILGKLYSDGTVRFFTHYSDLENKLQDEPPDTVILDGDNAFGMNTVKKIKELNPKVTVIVSASKDSVALEAMKNGGNGYLKKPFTEETVKKSIRNTK